MSQSEVIKLVENSLAVAEAKSKTVQEELGRATEQCRITCEAANAILARVVKRAKAANDDVVTTQKTAIAAYKESQSSK